MKDTRFIELVNLYVDRQISPDEQAALELEIQSNPQRRKVYQQYCRMHRATKLVYESFRTTSGQDEAAARQPSTIAHIESRRRQRRARWVYTAGGLAAAACFALVVARVNFLTNTESERPVVQVAAAQTPPAAPAVVAVQPAPARENAAEQTQQALAAMRHGLFVELDYAAMVAALREEEERLMSLPRAGSQQRMASLFDDGVFDPRQGLNAREQNSLRARQQQQRPAVEFTAFQFQR